MLKLKKQGISFVLGILLVLGAFGVTVSQTHTTYAASAPAAASIGVVNYQMLILQHPDAAKGKEVLDAATTKAQSDFDAKSATMSEQEKQAYYQQVQQGLNEKKQEILGAINDKVIAAVKSVADAKGMSMIVDSSVVVYGGQDITVEVGKIINGK